MFSDSGRQLKTIAPILFGIYILFFLIGGIYLMVAVGFFYGLLVMGFGAVSAYIQCLFYSAMGDLVVQNAQNAETNQKILQLLESQKSIQAPSEPVSAPEPAASVVPIEADNNMITCPNCGLTQLKDRNRCYNCGAEFKKQ